MIYKIVTSVIFQLQHLIKFKDIILILYFFLTEFNFLFSYFSHTTSLQPLPVVENLTCIFSGKFNFIWQFLCFFSPVKFNTYRSGLEQIRIPFQSFLPPKLSSSFQGCHTKTVLHLWVGAWGGKFASMASLVEVTGWENFQYLVQMDCPAAVRTDHIIQGAPCIREMWGF